MEDLQDLNRGETREIFWNAPEIFKEHFVELFDFIVLGLPFVLFGLWGATIIYPLYRWYAIVQKGQPENRFDQLGIRFQRMLFEGVGQGRVVREPSGIAHQVLFVSFLISFLGTSLITVEADTTLDFYFGAFYGVYKFMMDLAGVGLIGSSGYFLYRRYAAPTRALEQPKQMVDNFENESGYGFPLTMLFLIGITGFMLESSRIVAEPNSAVGLAFVGGPLAEVFRAMGTGEAFHHWVWIVHMIIVLSFLYSLTSTKLRHMFIAPVNIFFKRLGPGYRATPVTDFENAETFGVEKVEEYSWKQLLDMAACLECGRCTLNCPTVNTNKALNPKHLVMRQREQLVARHGISFLSAQMAKFTARDAGGADDADTGGEGGDIALREIGSGKPLMGGEDGQDDAWLAQADMINDVATEDVVWGCTTCGWCEEGCPVAIEHIQRIVDMRRNGVLMRAEFPQDLAKSFKGTENQSNPWGIAADQRAAWATEMNVPQMAEIGEDEKVDVLYWVGCAGSFDERNQKTSKALVKIFRQANMKFGILGMEENCTGEPARRLGNEYLYFSLASINVETLNRYKFDTIVTQCPHCFNTIKNEYPDIGGNFKVMHTTEFIESLLEQGKIKLEKDFMQKRLTMHDPCYLGRHNNIHEAPRKILDQIPGMVREDVENSGRKTFCCGAGGGQFWKEEEHGTARINETRLDQLMEAKPDTVAVACPFCTTMITDATKAKGIEESVQVKDVVEIVADSLE
ncbi:MAG: (Fe-S)-binding protein [Candidatus Binatia bacterium]|nr:(Fe-S)-binding protein [Candidatus Binatia bacterium]